MDLGLHADYDVILWLGLFSRCGRCVTPYGKIMVQRNRLRDLDIAVSPGTKRFSSCFRGLAVLRCNLLIPATCNGGAWRFDFGYIASMLVFARGVVGCWTEPMTQLGWLRIRDLVQSQIV